MKKIGIKIIAFMALLILIAGILFRLTITPNDYRNYQWIGGFYEEPENSLDAVFIGGSNTYAFFEAPLAWEKYGISVWPYACNSQTFLVAEYAIKEIIKTQPDALIIISINGIDGTVTQQQIHYLTDYMPLSKNKLDLISYMADLGEIDKADRLEFIFPFIRYHSRWDSLTEEDFHYTSDGLKGGSIYSAFLGTSKDVSGDFRTTSTTIPLYPDLQESLDNLLNFCDGNNIQVLFVTSPQAITNEDKIARLNTINKIVSERGYDTLNLIDLIDDVGIDLTTDYYNSSHTNIHGAIKITDYISRYLIDNYNLTDKRGAYGYESWDESYRLYLDEILPYVLQDELDSENRNYKLAAPAISSLSVYGTSMTLKWEDKDNVDGYKIYRRERNPKDDNIWSNYVEIADVSSDTLSYKDTGLKISWEYNYTVIPYLKRNGVNKYGKYLINGKSATALLNAPELIGLDGTENHLTLTWKEVKGADGYTVLRRRPGRSWVTLEDVGDKTSYTDTEMASGMSYEYTVKAYITDELTDSDTLGSQNNKPLLWLGSPDPPEIRIEAHEPDTVTLAWDYSEGFEGFNVLRKVNDGEWDTLKSGLKFNAVEYIDDSISFSDRYCYKVVGYIKNNGETFEYESNEINI